MIPSLLSRSSRRAASLLGLVAALALLPVAASAQTPGATPESEDSGPDASAKVMETLRSLHPQEGKVALPDGLATLNVPEHFCYLDASDSRKLLVEVWRNPPAAAQDVLGMIMPTRDGLPDAGNWGAVMTYDAKGYVSDKDADSLDYNALLKQMQESSQENNAARVKAGFEPIELVGWAAPPRYDKADKKFYWAKELKFGDTQEHTLNYSIRILGRRGVLNLNVVAQMNQLQEIEQSSPLILGMVNFNQGHRYADFNPKTDKVAEYGLAGLVAVGVLAKVGAFKGLWIALAAGWKFIVLGLAAVGGFIKKIFGGRGVRTHDTPSSPSGSGL